MLDRLLEILETLSWTLMFGLYINFPMYALEILGLDHAWAFQAYTTMLKALTLQAHVILIVFLLPYFIIIFKCLVLI